MTREDKRAYNYVRDRLANDDYPVYSDEYELELAYKAGIEDAKNHPYWISVEEEMPPIGGIVLVAIPLGGELSVLPVSIKNESDFKFLSGMTHWMPLPEAPKEGGEE